MHRAVNQPGVEVHVRVQLALDEVLVAQRDALELEGDLHVLRHAGDLEHIVAQRLHDRCPRIVALVDAMAEAHQALLALAAFHVVDERRDVPDVTDILEHAQHGLVRAPVERAVERGDAGRDRRVGIDVRGTHGAHGVRGTVLLVVGVENEQDVDRPRVHRMGLVLRLRHPGDHRQEVLGVWQRVVGIDVGHPLHVPIGERRDRRYLRQEPDEGDVALVRVVNVLRARIERRQRGDARRKHRHRVRVVPESFHEVLDVLVHVRVHRDVGHPLVVLGLRGELAVAQQPRDFEE